jgi:hypothetical protein
MPLLTAFVKVDKGQDLACGIIPKKLASPQNAPECGANRGDFQGLRANLADPADLAFHFSDSAFPEPGFACGNASCFFSIRAGIQYVPDIYNLCQTGHRYVIETTSSELIVQLPTCSAHEHLASYVRSRQDF